MPNHEYYDYDDFIREKIYKSEENKDDISKW